MLVMIAYTSHRSDFLEQCIKHCLVIPEQRRKRDVVGLRAITTLSLLCKTLPFIGTNYALIGQYSSSD